MELTLTTTHLFFIANILFCSAYIVRDILWLRLLTVIAATSTFPYFYSQPEPLWSAIFWQSAFLLINAINIIFLLYERRPVNLSEDESRVRRLAFRSLSERELSRLLKIAEWHELAPGDVLIQKGSYCEHLYMIFNGQVRIEVNQKVVANRRDGNFVGEMSYLTGDETSADVIADQPTRIVSWDKAKLNAFFDRHNSIKTVVHSVLGFDMAGKLSLDSAS